MNAQRVHVARQPNTTQEENAPGPEGGTSGLGDSATLVVRSDTQPTPPTDDARVKLRYCADIPAFKANAFSLPFASMCAAGGPVGVRIDRNMVSRRGDNTLSERRVSLRQVYPRPGKESTVCCSHTCMFFKTLRACSDDRLPTSTSHLGSNNAVADTVPFGQVPYDWGSTRVAPPIRRHQLEGVCLPVPC